MNPGQTNMSYFLSRDSEENKANQMSPSPSVCKTNIFLGFVRKDYFGPNSCLFWHSLE